MANPRAYKRRWRNLLLNRRYQLSFTVVLVGMAALLMGLLGWWVKDVAYYATQVAVNSVVEAKCPPDPAATPAPALAPAAPAAPADPAPRDPAAGDQEAAGGDEAGKEAAGPDAPAGDDAAGEGDDKATGERERPEPSVVIEESKIRPIAPAVDPAVVAAAQAKHRRCKKRQAAAVESLWDNYELILYVLTGTTLLLIIGLAFYGIKMTHRVAGPLHKVGLYLDKISGGTYDTVYNLRKGDQLASFYRHFKAAHAALSRMQREDIAVLEEAVAALREAVAQMNEKADEKAPALEVATEELAELLEAKKLGMKAPEPSPDPVEGDAKDDHHG
jgi:hypothetical protein